VTQEILAVGDGDAVGVIAIAMVRPPLPRVIPPRQVRVNPQMNPMRVVSRSYANDASAFVLAKRISLRVKWSMMMVS
jgi:hypothetical protein